VRGTGLIIVSARYQPKPWKIERSNCFQSQWSIYNGNTVYFLTKKNQVYLRLSFLVGACPQTFYSLLEIKTACFAPPSLIFWVRALIFIIVEKQRNLKVLLYIYNVWQKGTYFLSTFLTLSTHNFLSGLSIQVIFQQLNQQYNRILCDDFKKILLLWSYGPTKVISIYLFVRLVHNYDWLKLSETKYIKIYTTSTLILA